jgi:hypothetical protein
VEAEFAVEGEEFAVEGEEFAVEGEEFAVEGEEFAVEGEFATAALFLRATAGLTRAGVTLLRGAAFPFLRVPETLSQFPER